MNKIIKILQENIIFAYVLSVLITYQFYFPVIKEKNLTVFAVAAIILGLFSVKNEYLQIKRYQIFYYMLFLFFIYISFFYSAGKNDALKYLFYLTLPVLIYFYFKQYSGNKEKILKIYIFSAIPYLIFVYMLAIFEAYELNVLKLPVMKLFIEPDTLKYLTNLNYYAFFNIWEKGRIGGFFVNAQIAAIFAGFNIIISAWLCIKQKKMAYFAVLILWVISMGFYGSRIAIIVLMLVVFVGGVILLGKNKRYKKIGSLVLLGLSMIFVAGMLLFINPRSRNITERITTLNGRTGIWEASMGVIKNNWLFGVGLDGETWTKKYNVFAEKISARTNTPPHNVFLEIWGKSGIFAVSMFLLFLIFGMYKNIKLFKESGDHYYLLVFLAFLFSSIFALVENMFFMDIRILAVFWMILGLNPEQGRINNERI